MPLHVFTGVQQASGGGGKSAVGTIIFTSTSSGAFSIPLSAPITPTQIILNPNASIVEANALNAEIADVNNLDYIEVPVIGSTPPRQVEVSITAFVQGAVQGTITGNTLAGAETAKLSVVGFS